MAQYFWRLGTAYIGSTDTTTPPQQGAVQVPFPPTYGNQKWNSDNNNWDDPLRPPDPEGFLKYAFAGDNVPLLQIFGVVVATCISNPMASFWYQQMVHGSRQGLFVIGPTPTELGDLSDPTLVAQAREIGWSKALYQCVEACALTTEQRAVVNAALPTFGLYGVA